jgi:hypothetical protein
MSVEQQKREMATGFAETNDPFVVFLFMLLRDHLTVGQVETTLQEIEDFRANETRARGAVGYTVLSNQYLAGYVEEVVQRIKSLSP